MIKAPSLAVTPEEATLEGAVQVYRFADFWNMSPEEGRLVLLQAIQEAHTWHYARNPAYRHTVGARGVGEAVDEETLPRLLRPTAQTFKSYIDALSTPFPQDQPRPFVSWLADQLSIEIPRGRFNQFRHRYTSLEALLRDIEQVYGDFGFEISTSSGTSGRSTILVHDQDGIDKTVESFYLCFQRYMGMQVDHRAVFIMPRETRIAMARMVGFCFSRLAELEGRLHYAIPFPAYPDQVRIRSGRTLRAGWRGALERRLWMPLMNLLNERLVMPRAVRQAVNLLERAEAAGEKVLLFAGWEQLHAVALELRRGGRIIRLQPGSLLGSGGGFKGLYPFTREQIAADLGQTLQGTDGQPLPLRDVYGMAEANWAAMQCRQGNYHVPPWVYAITLDEDDRLQLSLESTGLLAFFDPVGGGCLFPPFFKTADRVRLVNGGASYEAARTCPCGEMGAYILDGSIQRVDLVDEAGCAAQL
jgi:hypothetical protein